MGFSPDQSYPAGRLSSIGFIGQTGNIGSNNGLAGNSNNSNTGGTNAAGAGTSSNDILPNHPVASVASSFALVKTTTSPSGMGNGSGGSSPALSTSTLAPFPLSTDFGGDLKGERPVYHSSTTSPTAFFPSALPLASGTITKTNADFPKATGEIELPVNVAFNKNASTVSVAGFNTPNYVGITDTKIYGNSNNLADAQQAVSVDEYHLTHQPSGTANVTVPTPLYTPSNEPGGQGPAIPNASQLAGGRSNSNQLGSN